MPYTVTLTLHNESDNVLEIKARDIVGAIDLSGATVTYDLLDSLDASQDSGSLSHAPSGSPDADGNYIFRAVIQDTIVLTAGGSYTVVVVFNGGADLKKTIKAPAVAQYATN